jgi:glutamine synthetase type III
LKEKAGVKFSDEALEDQKSHLAEVTDMIYYVRKNMHAMLKFLDDVHGIDEEEKAKRFFSELKPLMEHIRKHSDLLECVISDEHWDLPKYREMLFVK